MSAAAAGPAAPSLALLGGLEPWPFAGHVRGSLTGPQASVSWVGRLGPASDPERAWRASRALERVLRRPDAPAGDRRRVLTVLWTRLDGLSRALGSGDGGDLVLLLAARDADGVALSAVGVHTLFALRDHALHPWLAAPHPLLAPAGRPESLPGALVLESLPGWLFAWDGSGPSPAGMGLQDGFRRSGVHG